MAVTCDVSTQEERMEYHKETCIPLGKILEKKGAQFKPWKTLGPPYADGVNKGIMITCKICGVEVYVERRKGERIAVYAHKWYDNPNFTHWKNRKKMVSVLTAGGVLE